MTGPDATSHALSAVYGHILVELADAPPGSLQTSPRVPGATLLGDVDPASLSDIVVYAPESTLERRRVLAEALLAVRPGGAITVLAPNKKGGTRLARELSDFGCSVDTSSRRHHRIAVCRRPSETLNMANIEEALKMGTPRLDPALGLWTQPGLFSWNRVDPGSALLLRHLPPLEGAGADLGCGYGLLARAVLSAGTCRRLTLIDIDRRALDMASRNVPDDNFEMQWADVRAPGPMPCGLDFVVMNPPFHDGRAKDLALGRAFIERAAAMLRSGGTLWMTANRHLPYEEALKAAFTSIRLISQEQGYKIYMACK